MQHYPNSTVGLRSTKTLFARKLLKSVKIIINNTKISKNKYIPSRSFFVVPFICVFMCDCNLQGRVKVFAQILHLFSFFVLQSFIICGLVTILKASGGESRILISQNFLPFLLLFYLNSSEAIDIRLTSFCPKIRFGPS